MGYAIERRLKWDLFAFLLVSREYFEDLGQYLPDPQRDYRSSIEPHLGQGWQLKREGIWYHALPDEVEVRDQGFKIHLSAVSRTAPELLQRVLPLLAQARVPFKVLLDGFILDFVNSKNYSRASSGKFVTVYPQSTEECGELLESLDRATQGLSGPYILSDRPFRESRVVFYRYGGFRPYFELNVFGEQEPRIRAANGALIPDIRLPYFRLPPGIEDPFGSPPETHNGQVVLGDRYLVDGSLRFSNSGGVYAAVDQKDGAKVVIKEARRFINDVEGSSGDAIAILKKEARVLQALGDTGVVPRYVDDFQEWEHHFLVEELLEGVELSSYRALDDVGLLLQRNIAAEDVHLFCQRLAKLARNLLKAVRAFHHHEIIIGDLSPMNILVDPDTLNVRLIDFEGAFLVGETTSVMDSTITAGYASERRLSGELPSFADDFHALGSVLYSVLLPVQPLFPLNPAARRRFLLEIEKDYDLPVDVGHLISALLDGDVDRAETAVAQLAGSPGLRSWNPGIVAEPELSEAEVQTTIRGIGDYILSSADTGRTDRLWPADYRIFTTNPLNLAYGALGTALFLTREHDGLPKEIERWILDKEGVDNKRYPPGLFVGLAGVAWGLAELGHLDRAVDVMDEACRSPLLDQGWDLFFGAAGFGLASLYLWGRTGEKRFLEAAEEAAERVRKAARSDDEGLFWINADGTHYYGYAHGGSGVALFFLRLYQATGNSEHLATGKAALDYEISRAIFKLDYAVWYRSQGDNLLAPYWRYGTAGIGSVLLRYHVALAEASYLDLAEKAARYISFKYAVHPGQFVGLAGMGEFLLDMYHFTGDPRALQEAQRVARGILLYRVETADGIAFPGEELVRLSTDFGTGSAGIGLFLARLLAPGDRLFYEFDLPGPEIPGGEQPC